MISAVEDPCHVMPSCSFVTLVRREYRIKRTERRMKCEAEMYGTLLVWVVTGGLKLWCHGGDGITGMSIQ